MINKILAAYDGSAPAAKAYRFALDLAKRYGADLLVLAVAHYKELFDALKTEAASQGLIPHFEIVAGHPANQIVYRAEQNGVDLIVVGHRGRSFFERLLVGSVSKQVLTHAHCPVLVVR